MIYLEPELKETAKWMWERKNTTELVTYSMVHDTYNGQYNSGFM